MIPTDHNKSSLHPHFAICLSTVQSIWSIFEIDQWIYLKFRLIPLTYIHILQFLRRMVDSLSANHHPHYHLRRPINLSACAVRERTNTGRGETMVSLFFPSPLPLTPSNLSLRPSSPHQSKQSLVTLSMNRVPFSPIDPDTSLISLIGSPRPVNLCFPEIIISLLLVILNSTAVLFSTSSLSFSTFPSRQLASRGYSVHPLNHSFIHSFIYRLNCPLLFFFSFSIIAISSYSLHNLCSSSLSPSSPRSKNYWIGLISCSIVRAKCIPSLSRIRRDHSYPDHHRLSSTLFMLWDEGVEERGEREMESADFWGPSA